MKRLIIFSGAGLSAESGVPTFRDSGGLWHNHSVDEVCNLDNFDYNYFLVNEFYNNRRTALASVEPNLAHNVIAELQSKYPSQVINTTTNVDDLLEIAGCDNVQHLHGKLTEVIYKYKHTDQGEPVDIGYTEISAKELLNDKLNIKPNVVFFGEAAPEYESYHHLCDSLTSDDLVIVIGSSDLVVPFGLDAKYGSGLCKNLDDRPKSIIRINPWVASTTSSYPEDRLIAESYSLQTGKTAVEWFSDEDNIKMIEEHLGWRSN